MQKKRNVFQKKYGNKIIIWEFLKWNFHVGAGVVVCQPHDSGFIPSM